MTKKIGIPLNVAGDNSLGIGYSYLDFISKFGQVVLISPYDSVKPPDVDLVIAPGGADLLPASYGAVPNFRTQKPNIYLEHFDSEILPEYIKRKTPVFGICRGMQRLWVMFGGRLDQHNGWHEQSKNQFDQCHELIFTKKYEEYSKLIKKVTSRHHQCADASEAYGIPDELEVVAYAKATGVHYYPAVVEAFKHKELPIFGVQFHPEDHDDSDKLSSQIINEFLNI